MNLVGDSIGRQSLSKTAFFLFYDRPLWCVVPFSDDQEDLSFLCVCVYISLFLW